MSKKKDSEINKEIDRSLLAILLLLIFVAGMSFYFGNLQGERLQEQLVNKIAPDFCQNTQYWTWSGAGEIKKEDVIVANFTDGRSAPPELAKDCKAGWGIECWNCKEGWKHYPYRHGDCSSYNNEFDGFKTQLFCGEEILK